MRLRGEGLLGLDADVVELHQLREITGSWEARKVARINVRFTPGPKGGTLRTNVVAQPESASIAGLPRGDLHRALTVDLVQDRHPRRRRQGVWGSAGGRRASRHSGTRRRAPVRIG
jgi:hypothetical protein